MAEFVIIDGIRKEIPASVVSQGRAAVADYVDTLAAGLRPRRARKREEEKVNDGDTD